MRRTRTSRVRDIARGPARGSCRSAGTEHIERPQTARIAPRLRSLRPDRHGAPSRHRPRGVTVDHETDVAAPKRGRSEVDERIAAFKRGAPLPRPPAPRRLPPRPPVQPRPTPVPRPPVPTEAPEAPKPPGPHGHARTGAEGRRPDDAPTRVPPPRQVSRPKEAREPVRRAARAGDAAAAAAVRRPRPAEDSTQNGSTRTDTEADGETDPPVTARVRVAGPADLDDRRRLRRVVRHGGDDRWRLDVVRGAPQAPAPWRPRPRPWRGAAASRRPGRRTTASTTAPEQQTAESQRDDAAPDEPTGATGQPSRRRSGSKAASGPASKRPRSRGPARARRVGQERQRRRRGCQACVRRPAFPQAPSRSR